MLAAISKSVVLVQSTTTVADDRCYQYVCRDMTPDLSRRNGLQDPETAEIPAKMDMGSGRSVALTRLG